MPASPEQRRIAHSLVAAAIRNGEIVRPDVCSACAEGGRINAHHDDYGQPLAVRWLCTSCHKTQHWSEDPPAVRKYTQPAPAQLCLTCHHSIYWHGEGPCGFHRGCTCRAYEKVPVPVPPKFY